MPGPEDGALRLCAVSVETSLGWRARYDALVLDLRCQLSALPPGQPLRLAKSTSNLFRPRENSATNRLDVTPFDGVLHVDPDVAEAPTRALHLALDEFSVLACPVTNAQDDLVSHLEQRVVGLLPEDVDEHVYAQLRDFSEPIAIEIATKFLEADMSQIRNKTGFFIGILKRYRQMHV